jgi:hypothetical protein
MISDLNRIQKRELTAKDFDERLGHRDYRDVDPMAMANRTAWDAASQKYIDDYDDLLAQAASGSSLNDTERALLRDILTCSPAGRPPAERTRTGRRGPRPVRGSVGGGRRLQ